MVSPLAAMEVHSIPRAIAPGVFVTVGWRTLKTEPAIAKADMIRSTPEIGCDRNTDCGEWTIAE